MKHEDIFINSSGKKVHAIKGGNGEIPFHFLHANGLCAGTYLPFLKLFSDQFNMIATDIPGHGDSDHHGFDLIKHWDIFIEAIKESITQNFNTPVVGVGHSLGAVITYITAAKYPELFSKIILIDPVIFPKRILIPIGIAKKLGILNKIIPLANGARRRKKIFESREEAYSRFSSGKGMFATWSDEFIKSFTTHGLKDEKDGTVSLKCDPETEAQIYESILLDIWDYPKKIKCPTLLIRGEKTDTFNKYAAKRLIKEVNKCRLVNIADSGHFVPMEKAALCYKQIKAFVEK